MSEATDILDELNEGDINPPSSEAGAQLEADRYLHEAYRGLDNAEEMVRNELLRYRNILSQVAGSLPKRINDPKKYEELSLFLVDNRQGGKYWDELTDMLFGGTRNFVDNKVRGLRKLR